MGRRFCFKRGCRPPHRELCALAVAILTGALLAVCLPPWALVPFMVLAVVLLFVL